MAAEAFQQLNVNARVCAGVDATMFQGGLGGGGVEGTYTSTVRSFIHTASSMDRRGDVLIFLAGDGSTPLAALSTQFDSTVKTSLDGVCAKQDGTVQDGQRNPISAAGYSPYTTTETVTIADVPLPTIPSRETPAITPIPLPGKNLAGEPTTPDAHPTFPVTDAMPAVMEYPTIPDSPAKAATTTTTINVLAADKTGPGCGWSFTGMAAPAFDPVAAQNDVVKKHEAASAQLETAAKAWQTSVLQFYRDYAAYAKLAGQYATYRDQVVTVNKKWEDLGKQWDAYTTNERHYEDALKARKEFDQSQQAAQTEFDAATKVCEAQSTATASPSDSPTASPSPTSSPAPTVSCPPNRPAILDATPPTVPDQPVKPGQ